MWLHVGTCDWNSSMLASKPVYTTRTTQNGTDYLAEVVWFSVDQFHF